MLQGIQASFYLQRGDFTLNARLSIPSSGISALFGPSGCGKTTLLRAIAGLEQAPEGRLSIDNMTWQQGSLFLPPHQRPLGFVFQESSLFEHLNVQANVEYGYKRIAPSERRISLQQAIELLDIGPLLSRRTGSLSGGEKQRVAIARALAVSPRLLLMDEPLAALDQGRKQELLPYIKSLHRELEIPIIYVSHSLEEVSQLADYLILMDAGRISAAGEIHQMFTRLDLPLAHELEASAIIDTTVCGHDSTYQLMQLEFAGGKITVPGISLKLGDKARLRLIARDVSITLEHQSNTSILNIIPVTVTEILPLNSAQVTLKLMAQETPLLSRITAKSAADLGLHVGKRVYAQVKSVALLS